MRSIVLMLLVGVGVYFLIMNDASADESRIQR